MPTERKIYIVCGVAIVFTGLCTVYLLVRTWSIGAPASLLTAMVLIIVGHLLAGYMVWRALHGIRPTAGSPVSIALKLLSAGIFLSLFGPRIWAALRR